MTVSVVLSSRGFSSLPFSDATEAGDEDVVSTRTCLALSSALAAVFSLSGGLSSDLGCGCRLDSGLLVSFVATVSF